MKPQEWTFPETHNKHTWPVGPWNDEPDKKQWRDEETGFPCLIVRNPVGALCGYVGVPEAHPWFGVELDSYAEGMEVPDVHGGVTFASFCSGHKQGVCHVVETGENDRVWWVGFDCAHAGDVSPKYDVPTLPDDSYKDISYVAAQCHSLALQAKEVSA